MKTLKVDFDSAHVDAFLGDHCSFWVYERTSGKMYLEYKHAGPSKKYSASHLGFLERSFFGCSKKA
jgi:hypothetical protein